MLGASTSRTPPTLVCFASFEVDLHSGELRKHGIKLKLQEKPFQILALLLEHAGDLVTREELRQKLWSDTFVDFDHSLGTAMTKLRQALGDSAQNPKFIETVGSRGYRLIVSVSTVESPQPPSSTTVTKPVAPPQPEAPKISQSQRFLLSIGAGLLGGALLLAIVLGFDISGMRGWLRRISNPPIRSLAVLPLLNVSGDQEQDAFADGMTDALINVLGRVGKLRVISRTSVMQYKGTKKTLPEIARELNVDAVVEGSVMRADRRVRISAELLRAPEEERIWAETYERELSDVLTLQDEVASAIAREIKIKLTPQEAAALSVSRPVNSGAYRDYILGRSFLYQRSPDGLHKAISSFQQAIERDPNYAEAYAGLADAQNLIIYYDQADRNEIARAEASARRALQLNDSLAEAHASLGFAEFFWEWNWPEAEYHLQRAVALNPSYAVAHRWYGEYLMAVGNKEQSLQECLRATQLDPLSPMEHATLAFLQYLARDYEAARQEAQIAIELGPNFMVAHATAGLVAIEQGKNEDAIGELRKAVQLSEEAPYYVAELGVVYARAGLRAEAEQSLRDWDKLAKLKRGQMSQRSVLLAALGEREEAMRALEEAVARRDDRLVWLKVDPQFDVLRDEPQFSEVRERLNFPK